MPLFTVLSGFVYAARPTQDWPQYGSLVRAKVRRVLLPLLVVGTLVFLAKLLNPSSTSGIGPGDWWKPYLLGTDHIWFLQAIFLIFLITGMLDALGALKTKGYWLAATALSALLYISSLVPSIALFGIGPALRLLPFFLIGYGLKRFAPELSLLSLSALVALFTATFAPRMMTLTGAFEIEDIRLDRALAVVIGASSILVLFHFRKTLTNGFLSWVGGYAFGIYLFHYFALQAVWIGSEAIGLGNEFALFAIGLTLGIGLPIILQIITRPSRAARLVLFGEKYAPRKERARTAAASVH